MSTIYGFLNKEKNTDVLLSYLIKFTYIQQGPTEQNLIFMEDNADVHTA